MDCLLGSLSNKTAGIQEADTVWLSSRGSLAQGGGHYYTVVGPH